MDSVTQIALGATVGEVTLGKKIGNKAILWGGLIGLLPDLDVLIPLGDAVKDFTYHRSASHSLFVLTLLTPFMVWLILKIHPKTADFRNRWIALVFLAFTTHILLDSFTVYGTQVFWPMTTPPVMWSTIFIIDPIYSLPLLIGVIAALKMSRNTSRGHTFAKIGLALSSLYLVWTIGVKSHVGQVAKESLEQQNISHNQILTLAAPFNTMLWRVLVMDNENYYEGFYSIFDKDRDIDFKAYPNQKKLLDSLQEHWPVARLQWFTHDNYAVEQMENDIVIKDLRMGFEPTYIFQFKIGEMVQGETVPTKSVQVNPELDLSALFWVWNRIWEEPSAETLSVVSAD